MSRWADDGQAPSNGDGRPPWTDPVWRAATIDWASTQLALDGRSIVGEVTQPHIRPWSTVLRIPTDDGVVWCKANGRGTRHEPVLLDLFRRRGVRAVLPPIAIDADRSLMLLPDGGSSLRDTRPDGTGDHDLGAWERILREYAGLQRDVEVAVDEMLSVGVPDVRPERLVEIVAGLVDDPVVWSRADPEDRDAAADARRRLPGLLPRIGEWAAELSGSGILATIQHDDLHSGNVLVGPAGDRIFDWGDASVAHPFGTMTTTMNSIEHKTSIGQHGRELRRLRDAYLEVWSDVAPLSVLVAAEERARLLGAISRAASWERAFRGLAPDQLDGHGGAVAAWLIELVARIDDAPTWLHGA